MRSPSTPIYPTATIALPKDALRAIFDFLPLQQASALKDTCSLFYQLFARRCARIVEKSEREWDASEVVKFRGTSYLGRWYEWCRRISVAVSASGGERVDIGEIGNEVYEWWINWRNWQERDRRAFITEVERLCDVYTKAKTFLENERSVTEALHRSWTEDRCEGTGPPNLTLLIVIDLTMER